MMTGKEKLYFLLNRIDDKRELTPKGEPVLIDPTGDLNRKYTKVDLLQLLTKLENDEKVVKVLRRPTGIDKITLELDPYSDYKDAYYQLELLPSFDKYFRKVQNEPEYQKFSSRRPSNPKSQDSAPLPKYTRKSLERIWNILQEIEEKRQLNPPDSEIRFPFAPPGLFGNDIKVGHMLGRKDILKKLESLEAISNLGDINEITEGADGFWSFNLGKNYQSVFNGYKKDYKRAAEEYQERSKPVDEVKPTDIVYEIKYSPNSREIVINGLFQLAKPDFDSENESVFTYLYKNPNKMITLKELKEKPRKNIRKTLHKIVENLGFKGDLKRAFFKVSKTSIYFRNPVTKEHLDELGITKLKLQ